MRVDCDYRKMMKEAGLKPTPRRFRVLEIIGKSTSPLSSQEVFETLSRTETINRVTVYRILDLLVEKKLVDRISSGARSFHYEIAPTEHHPAHSHFYCKTCGNIECLPPESLHLDVEALVRTFPGLLERIEIRLDGVCKNCLKAQKTSD